MSSDLSQLFKRAVLKTVINEGVPAKLGKADGSTIFYVDDAGTHHKDRVWARIGAGAAPAEAVVRCVSVPQTLNLPVIVADRDGVLTVIRTDLSRAVEWADGQLIDVSPHNWTHGRYGSDALYITGLSFLPLAAYPSDTPDLTVTVEQCFYRYQNTHKVFERTISDSLAAYRPTGLNITHYIILALDRSTNALAVIDGDDVSGGNRALPSASTVLATDGLRSEHFPICAIRFYNGQTQIMPRDIFMDLRLWAGESSASGSGSSGSAAVVGPDTSTDRAIARWDGIDGTLLQDSYPTIDDSGNVDLQGNELRDYSHQMIEANTGAAYEIDWSAAGIFELTLTDDPTFTFSNESAGRAVTLILIQDGVGGRTVTWPGAVGWPNDNEPTLSTGAGDVDVVTLVCQADGSTVSGFAASDVRTNQENTFTVGNQIIQPAVDTTTAFQVLDADGGAPVLSVDTVNERVGIGVAAPAGLLDIVGPVGSIQFADDGNSINFMRNGANYIRANAGASSSWQFQAQSTSALFIISAGRVGVNTTSFGGTQLSVKCFTKTYVGVAIKAAAAQTANLTEWQDSAGGNLVEISAIGHVGIGVAPTANEMLYGFETNINRIAYFQNRATASRASLSGADFRVDTTHATGNVTNMYGLFLRAFPTHTGTGRTLSAYGAYFQAQIPAATANGIMTQMNGGYFEASSVAGNTFVSGAVRAGRFLNDINDGTITNLYGNHITSTINSGTVANHYGQYIDDITGATTLNYAIYTNLGDVRFGDEVVIASPTATALTIGAGTAGIDYTLTVDGEDNDGVLTWMEDEAEWHYVDDVAIAADSKGLLLGAAQDMDIGYDGTDGYLRTDLVTPSDLNLDCGAAKTIELHSVVYEDLQVSINNLARGITAPTDRFYDHGVGAGVAYPVLGFAKNDYVWFDVQTHHAMKLNTVLDNHIHFVLPNTTTIGHKFVFQLDVIVAGIDGTWAVPAGSPFTATHTVAANDDTTHRLLDIADIPASNTTVSSVYKCKLTRIDGVATEYASEVYLEFSDCHYQKNTMGSRQEAAK